MKRNNYKVLSLAAASGKVGYVLMIDGHPKHWGLSVKASKSPENAEAFVRKLIDDYVPDCVVTERITKHSRKSAHNHTVISALSKSITAQLHVEVERIQEHENKYDEMDTLIGRFPQLNPWSVPKRPIWMPEQRNTIIFEALAMSLHVIDKDA